MCYVGNELKSLVKQCDQSPKIMYYLGIEAKMSGKIEKRRICIQ